MTSTNQKDQLLTVRNLKTYFYTEDGVVKAVDGIDLTVRRGEVVGLVGESGCGKSVTSLSIMKLIGQPGKIVEGEITFDGKELVGLPESEMVHIRGNRISMIFQQPLYSRAFDYVHTMTKNVHYVSSRVRKIAIPTSRAAAQYSTAQAPASPTYLQTSDQGQLSVPSGL